MRSAIGFLSFLAFGFLAAGVLTVVGTGPVSMLPLDLESDTPPVHLGSLMLGLALGIVLSALARVSWTQLPRRFVGWLLQYERSFYRIALVGVFAGVLLFY